MDYWVWGDRYSMKVTSKETTGAYAIVEAVVQPGSSTPPHIHHAEDEIFYILAGRLSLWCDGKKIDAEPGALVAIPRGTVHHFKNESGQVARVLLTLVPGGFEQFFVAIGDAVTQDLPEAPPVTEELIGRGLALASQYHLEIVS